MKMLTLLRHAKSGWDDPGLRDFDRPLNAKGRRAAQAMGRNWRALGLSFDHVVASPARRVTETLAEVEIGFGCPLSPTFDRRVYLAEPGTLIELVHDFPDGAGRALLVGHSPGLEQLVLMAADGELIEEVATKYPTATAAELCLADGWASLGDIRATLARFTRPRDLDPALGPDEG